METRRLNVVAKGQRRNILGGWSSGQDFANCICEPQGYWLPVGIDASVVVQLGKRKYVSHHLLDLGASIHDFDCKWIRQLTSRICLQPRSEALCPQITKAGCNCPSVPARDVCRGSPVKLQSKFISYTHTVQLCSQPGQRRGSPLLLQLRSEFFHGQRALAGLTHREATCTLQQLLP